jgi:hypothetical protein
MVIRDVIKISSCPANIYTVVLRISEQKIIFTHRWNKNAHKTFQKKVSANMPHKIIVFVCGQQREMIDLMRAIKLCFTTLSVDPGPFSTFRLYTWSTFMMWETFFVSRRTQASPGAITGTKTCIVRLVPYQNSKGVPSKIPLSKDYYYFVFLL